ncbi:MAG TPA: protein kinase [Candidatus Polarisedimenticolaceae bacterium]|nr:protein kinase [Candidatus Polarisedimenticolaceae bacterium]
MSADYHRRLTELFLHAVDLDPQTRRSWLDELRRDPSGIAADLESLLDHADNAPPLIATGPRPPRTAFLPIAGERAGPYRLLEPIGAGATAVVFRAEQSEPLRREVAIKLIRAGLETEALLARFATERQVLARMDHPNIARVLDAGRTSAGRPYVAMEFVRGEPLTAFCARRGLGVDERLRLLAEVCDAVHYAHQNAIIHRDLKPSNILVAEIAGRPVPKIIDFGIAKAWSRPGDAAAPLTEVGQLIGTPAYMSPEQALADGANLDIRADVYSLGVLLYELLVGCTPLEFRPERGLDELRRMIREQEPDKPSVRATSAALKRRLRGDLDSIASKALAKDRRHRYGTAADLAADIRRHLEHEPIHARPPRLPYRAGKYARKHRTAVTVAGALLPLLTLSTLALGLQARRASRVSTMLLRAYDAPAFIGQRGEAREPKLALRHCATRVRQELADNPLLQGRVLHSIGEALRGLGAVAESVPLLERAHARLRDELGADDPSTLSAANDLALAYSALSRSAGPELLADVLDSQRRTLGAEHPDTLRTTVSLALVLRETLRREEAQRLLASALPALQRVLGADDPETLVATSHLAAVELDLGHVDTAERLLRESIPRMVDGLVEKGRAVYNLACVHALRGDRTRALAGLREAVARGFHLNFFADPNLKSLFDEAEFVALVRRQRFQDRTFEQATERLAEQWLAEGRLVEAEALVQEALDALPAFCLSPRYTFEWLLARIYERQGRYREARPLVEQRIARQRQQGGDDGSWVGQDLWHQVQVELGCGDRAAAIRTIDESSRILGRHHRLGRDAWLRYNHARRLAVLGDAEAALAELTGAVEAGFDQARLVRDDLALRGLLPGKAFAALLARMSRREQAARSLLPAEAEGQPIVQAADLDVARRPRGTVEDEVGLGRGPAHVEAQIEPRP